MGKAPTCLFYEIHEIMKWEASCRALPGTLVRSRRPPPVCQFECMSALSHEFEKHTTRVLVLLLLCVFVLGYCWRVRR